MVPELGGRSPFGTADPWHVLEGGNGLIVGLAVGSESPSQMCKFIDFLCLDSDLTMEMKIFLKIHSESILIPELFEVHIAPCSAEGSAMTVLTAMTDISALATCWPLCERFAGFAWLICTVIHP